MAAFTPPATPLGTTITVPTGYTTVGEVFALSFPTIERAVIETSHFGTTTSDEIGGRTYMPGDLSDPGTMVVEAHFDGDTDPSMQTAAGTWTVTWRGGSGTTWAFSGFMQSYNVDARENDKMVATFTVKITGGINIG